MNRTELHLERAYRTAFSSTASPADARAANVFILAHLAERVDALAQAVGTRLAPSPAPVDSPFLDYLAAARFCGCSVKTLQNAKAAGELAAVPGGPGVCFTRKALQTWRTSPRPKPKGKKLTRATRGANKGAK